MTISLVNCKKQPEISKTRSQLLTQSNWEMVVFQHTWNNSGWYDDFAPLPDCYKDNVFSFTSNFIWTIDEGILKCYPTSPQIYRQGMWEFRENETKLFTRDTIGPETVEIKQLDETSLKTIRRDTLFPNNFYVTEIDYIH